MPLIGKRGVFAAHGISSTFRAATTKPMRRHERGMDFGRPRLCRMRAGCSDLAQFKRWVTGAGRGHPMITVRIAGCATGAATELPTQKGPATPGTRPEGKEGKLPGADPDGHGVDRTGRRRSVFWPTRLRGTRTASRETGKTSYSPVAEMREKISFVGRSSQAGGPSVAAAPVSRRRSAKGAWPLDRLKFLACTIPEPFARWEAGQQVATPAAARPGIARNSGARTPPPPIDPRPSSWPTRAHPLGGTRARTHSFAAEAMTLHENEGISGRFSSSRRSFVGRIHRQTAKPARHGARQRRWHQNSPPAIKRSPMPGALPHRLAGFRFGRRQLGKNASLAYTFRNKPPIPRAGGAPGCASGDWLGAVRTPGAQKWTRCGLAALNGFDRPTAFRWPHARPRRSARFN